MHHPSSPFLIRTGQNMRQKAIRYGLKNLSALVQAVHFISRKAPSFDMPQARWPSLNRGAASALQRVTFLYAQHGVDQLQYAASLITRHLGCFTHVNGFRYQYGHPAGAACG
jgi:hypothetical protein